VVAKVVTGNKDDVWRFQLAQNAPFSTARRPQLTPSMRFLSKRRSASSVHSLGASNARLVAAPSRDQYLRVAPLRLVFGHPRDTVVRGVNCVEVCSCLWFRTSNTRICETKPPATFLPT
jgi:hypothetical protein